MAADLMKHFRQLNQSPEIILADRCVGGILTQSPITTMKVLFFITVLVLSMALTDGQYPIWRVPSRRPSLLPIRRRIGPFVNAFPSRLLPQPSRLMPQPDFIPRPTRPLVIPPVRPVYKPSPALRAVIDSLTPAVDSKDKDVARIIKEIIQVLESHSAISVSRITRAVVDTFITGKPLDVGFKQSMSTAKADVITKALEILNALSGEQIVTLKSELSRKFGLNYKAEVTIEQTPPKYETPPEVKRAHENILIALKSTKTGNVNSEKILSDIIKHATSAEVNSVVPSHLSSSAKIVVDAFVSKRTLKPDHPSASILEALRSLPNDQTNVLMDQFLKVIAMNPQGDMGIIDGVSSIVLEEKNLTEATIRKKQIAEAEKRAAEQAQKINQDRIFQLELEQKRRADVARAEQLRRVEEQNKRFAEEASRTIRMMELENQRRMEAEKERLRRLESRNIDQFQAFKKHTEVINSLPIDTERELWRMNAHLLQKHGPEARKWLEDIKNNVTLDITPIVDSQTQQSGANGTADTKITSDKYLVAEGPQTVSVPVADGNSGLGGDGTDILSTRSNTFDMDIFPPSSGNIVIQSRDNIGVDTSPIRNRINMLPSTRDNIIYPIIPATPFNAPSQTTIIRQRFPERQFFNTIQSAPTTRRITRFNRPTPLRLFRNTLPTRNFDSRFRPVFFQ